MKETEVSGKKICIRKKLCCNIRHSQGYFVKMKGIKKLKKRDKFCYLRCLEI